MISNKLEAGTDYESVGSAESEMASITKDSSCFGDNSDRGGKEPKKKLKKLRSIKFSRFPSLRSSKRLMKSRNNHLLITLPANPSSSGQSTPNKMSDVSPCYMKATSSSDARKGSFQNPMTTSARRSSLKPEKSLTRMASLKFKRTFMSKSSGGTEVQRKAQRSRSIRQEKLEGRRPSTRSFKFRYQARSRNYESSFSSSYQNSKKSCVSKPKSTLSSNKSVRVVTRASSLRPVRVLTKMGTFKSKKSSTEKCCQICQSPNSSMHKATCSSILKDSKFPSSLELELQPGEHESAGTSVMKVCTYTYCSLHGHHHNAAPPLRRFISMRRRLPKTQKSMKRQCQFSNGKRSGNRKNELQANQMLNNGDLAVANATRAISPVKQKEGRDLFVKIQAEDPKGMANGVGASGGEDENLCDLEYQGEMLLSDTTHSNMSEATHEDRKEEKIGTSNNGEAEANSILTDKTRRPTDDEFLELSGSNSIGSSDFDLESLEEKITGNEEKKGELEPEHELFHKISTQSDSMPNRINDAKHKMQFKNQKYIGMWHLMYKHAVVGINRKVGNQLPLEELKDEEQVKDTNNLLGTNHCSSSEGFSEIGKGTSRESHDPDNQKNEIRQNEAIKLVQKAFDDILLRDFQDYPMDDASISSSISSDRELFEKSNGEGREWSISASYEPAKDSMVQNPETTWLKADSISTPKEERSASNVRNESDQKAPKSWSYLKKLILFNRFFKALEKVKNFNSRGPRYLSLKPGPEAEKVHLRHQTTDERKSTEEWMLDNALQQVISKLAPAQKRKVALLVEAFESVLPLSEVETSQRSNSAVCTRANPIQACICDGSSTQSGGETSQESNYEEFTEILIGKTSFHEKNFKAYPDQVGDFLRDKQIPPMKFSELRETSSDCCCIKTAQEITASQDTDEESKEKQISAINLDKVDNKFLLADGQPDSIISCSPEIKDPSSGNKFSSKPEDIVSTCHEEVGENWKVSKEITLSSEFYNGGSESEGRDSGMHILISEPCQLKERIKAEEEGNGRTELESISLPEVSSFEEFKPDCTIDVANEARFEKKRNVRLWYLVYKHMVSSIAATDGAKPHFGEAGEEEQLDDANSLPETSTSSSGQDSSEMDQETDRYNEADEQKVELHRIEAIKLVEEAIDEISLPEIQDLSPNDLMSTSDMIPAEGLSEEKTGEGGEPFISNYKDGFTESHKKYPGEKWLKYGKISTQEEDKAAMNVGKKSNKEMPRNWSTLKKWILLKRFIKALEKVGKFNAREPRYLPLEPNTEREKVHLRHQGMDQRKNGEEWMLDYALQQVVARLTPARKRKVELLVQAFETVIPTIGR
ncbi:hypothetical protein F2P56_006131 [Juglans regia]|uniref:Calmodulin-binding domain-containing protein n=2 Tax=Juglans regia TaxID=51240 RepID=A0A834D426_JUGRE|nr:calmodulin binding protein PICBP-like [Juglans regia]KAF5474216.1 hypothetical protein F2P56_006131 [Juglans regia]